MADSLIFVVEVLHHLLDPDILILDELLHTIVYVLCNIKSLFAKIGLMKLIVQRVNKAHVSAKSEVVGRIDRGLFVLVGVKEGDSKKDAEILAEKLAKLRVIADDAGKMNLSVKDVAASVLVVSQFTLYADTSKGNRPSFIKAAKPGHAEKLYENFVDKLKEKGVKVETGSFGEYMEIDAKLDGPVTIIIESGD